MYDERLESLIDAALADCELTPKERKILISNAAAQEIPIDEFEMVLDARMLKRQQEMMTRWHSWWPANTSGATR